jgi:hypothetical protein
MQDDHPEVSPDLNVMAVVRDELERTSSPQGRRISEKFFLAALGAIPWVGGFLAAAAAISSDEKAAQNDELRSKWLEEHKQKIEALRATLETIQKRFDSFRREREKEIDERIQDPEYLALVRQSFRVWDESETEEKRRFVANLVSNSAGTRLNSDDVVRLFISWLSLFHETHFGVIREIYQNPGSTRFDIWAGLKGDTALPREDSAEADLYRLLIRDLSMGGVIRQVRDVNEMGQFVRKRPARQRGSVSSTMESAFEDSKQYVLTELGKQFVHYTMNEVVTRLDGVSNS